MEMVQSLDTPNGQARLSVTDSQRAKISDFISRIPEGLPTTSTHTIEPSDGGEKLVLRFFFDGSASLASGARIEVFESISDLKRSLNAFNCAKTSKNDIERLRELRVAPNTVLAAVQQVDESLNEIDDKVLIATVEHISVSGICIWVDAEPSLL